MATDNQVVFFMADSCLLQNSLQISLHKILPKADEYIEELVIKKAHPKPDGLSI
ncbi:hypothetical protein [Aerococcus viridans]|uniref:hypothetical protein n=1 Tax=Aerococcus viridans TaxID=1377 RepID=UPI003B210383